MEIANTVSDWEVKKKLNFVITQALPLLPADIRVQVEAMLTPKSLAIMAGVLIAWVGSQFIGIGEIADAVLLVMGYFALGGVALKAAKELFLFAKDTVEAKNESLLDEAAQHFANAVTLIGVQAVMALLLKKRPRIFSGHTIHISPDSLAKGDGWFYKPSVEYSGDLPASRYGETDWEGNVTISKHLTPKDRKLTELHEKVHSVLTPKLYFLRRFRIGIRANGYVKSILLQYLEESLAETAAQIGVNRFRLRSIITGISFPISHGYVTVAGIGREMAGLLLGPINLGGMIYNVFYSMKKPTT